MFNITSLRWSERENVSGFRFAIIFLIYWLLCEDASLA